jgi:hypothetical protein
MAANQMVGGVLFAAICRGRRGSWITSAVTDKCSARARDGNRGVNHPVILQERRNSLPTLQIYLHCRWISAIPSALSNTSVVTPERRPQAPPCRSLCHWHRHIHPCRFLGDRHQHFCGRQNRSLVIRSHPQTQVEQLIIVLHSHWHRLSPTEPVSFIAVVI